MFTGCFTTGLYNLMEPLVEPGRNVFTREGSRRSKHRSEHAKMMGPERRRLNALEAPGYAGSSTGGFID